MGHVSVTLKMFGATLFTVLALSASAAQNLNIKRAIHLNNLPSKEVAQKKISIVFDGSPKMSKVLQEKLKGKGFAVVSDADDADVKFKLSGIYLVTGAGKASMSGPLGDMLENAISIGDSMKPDYQHQNVSLIQMAATSTFFGSLSPSDLINWLGQKSGISGRINQAITGDPRGFCWNENCNKLTSQIVIRIGDGQSHWWIQGEAKYENVVLDLVFADLVEHLLAPIYDLKNDDSSNKNEEKK
jgi:hypothetical protein